jgi:hypothetical protein
MLSTALQLKVPLQRIIQKLFDENRIESTGEWVGIEAISNFLIPFNEATEETCGDKFACISLVIPWYNEILDHIQSTKKKYPEYKTLRSKKVCRTRTRCQKPNLTLGETENFTGIRNYWQYIECL